MIKRLIHDVGHKVINFLEVEAEDENEGEAANVILTTALAENMLANLLLEKYKEDNPYELARAHPAYQSRIKKANPTTELVLDKSVRVFNLFRFLPQARCYRR